MMTNVKPIRIAAPFTGWAAPLDEVPDPVFSERMMGDGIAIDPLDGTLHAPCEARVIAVAPTGHSVTLALANGAELLIHIGLETVALQGEGFTPLVADGVQVRTGDPLIRFDMDLLAERAKSLITPIVIVNEGYRIALLACDRAVTAGEPLMEVVPIDTNVVAETPVSDDTARCDIVVPLANGIHARPAAKIVAAFKPYSADIRFVAHGREANGRSTVSLLSLGLKYGDALTISAKGQDARAAVASVASLIESGMGESHVPEVKPTAQAQPASEGPLFRGVRAAPGLALGPVVQFRPADAEIVEQGDGLAHETAALDAAIHALGEELDTPLSRPAQGSANASIAAAHRALLDDPELLDGARLWLEQGKSAAFAWRTATRVHAEAIRATGDPLLIERIADLIDIERQLIAKLAGETLPVVPDLPEGAILIADELLPSQFMALDAASLGGIATASGGPTSHVAILAASAGVPMLVAAGPGLLGIPSGHTAIIDAHAATLDSDPSSEALARARSRLASARIQRASETAAAHGDCAMADGTRIEIFANLASAEEAERAVKAGAEGCGLLRTEFLFLDREDAPSEAGQQRAYTAIAKALEGRPLIVRTLDIGGDKPVPYLPFPHEDNPALGNRGVRLSLSRPELLAAQFRAILTAMPAAQCRIMVPMIVDRDELRDVRALFDEAVRAVGVVEKVPLGVMIETPSAALLADSIAEEADFLSVGTNDLTQYALAADRGNPALASRIDALHPAVLRLIAEAGKGASAQGKWMGICGGLASDPTATALLIGLGATELSVTPAAIPSIKARVRSLRLNECRDLASHALTAASVQEVRALLEGDE